jgi:hypothetical protein
MRYLAFIILFISSVSSYAQKTTTTWDKWQWLMGDWKSIDEGRTDQANGTFSFKPDLDQKVLVRKGHTEYSQLRANPMVHDDLMVIYPGYTGTPAKAVYFDNQGHSISYTFIVTDKTVVFTSERTANSPVFRMTYYKLDSGMVNTKFETSQDGTSFQTYMENKSKRVKPTANHP